MKRRQRTQCLVIMLIAICLLTFSACTSPMSISPADLLSREDYDWGYWPSVTFRYLDHEYHSMDVHRDDVVLRQAFSLQDQLVTAYWDGTYENCELEATEGTDGFYLLSSNIDSNIILIIPTPIQKGWFEDTRPLAFCLKAD